ncbi:MAG: transcriptional regulator NrdR [Acidobacteria bacterium]|nr:MAG: transcriptional regulator NrdR [Acidobacteriota bacterium]
MRCPFCAHLEDKVVDSRESKDGDSIRRRRECLACTRRFTSYERIDEIPYMVVKKDGKREHFYRDKVIAGLLKAAEKRPISTTQLEVIADEVEKCVQDAPDREFSTTDIGKVIMRRLKTLDKVETANRTDLLWCFALSRRRCTASTLCWSILKSISVLQQRMTFRRT